MPTLKEHSAIFWLNAVYPTAKQWSFDNPIHKWAKRKLRKATKILIPMAIEAFKESYPEIANNPRVRYTLYPAVDPTTGYADVMCIGETGMSIEGALAHINVGIGLTDCVFHANANGELDE